MLEYKLTNYYREDFFHHKLIQNHVINQGKVAITTLYHYQDKKKNLKYLNKDYLKLQFNVIF